MINASQLERMKKLRGMRRSSVGVINGGIMHEGLRRRSMMPPLGRFRTAASTDSDRMALRQSNLPFTTLNFAVTGKMPGGMKVIRQTISREDALIAHTRKNAFLVFQEDTLGSIQPGKLADLVVLDRDYLTIPPDQIKDIRPVMTMIGGRIAYDGGPISSTR
jgi:predicted amidohydrolase YtcJ